MSGGKHTPGPWSYRSELHDDWGVVRAGRFFICQAKDPRYMDNEHLAQCREVGRDPWEANARLISAAPDLLDAIKPLLALLEPVETLELLAAPELEKLNAARTAIAKAEGGAA